MISIPTDLAAGARRRPIEQFADFDARLARRLRLFVRPHRRLLLLTLVTITGFVLAQLAFPSLIRKAVDSITGKPGTLPLDDVLLLFALAILVNAAMGYASDMSAARLAQRIIFDLRRAMFVHLQRLPMAFMDQVHVGRIMSRLQGDVNALQEFFETSIIAVGDLALLAGITVVLFVMEWRLALLTLILFPALAAVRAIWLPRARGTFAHARDMSSATNGALAENIAGVRVVLGLRREAFNLGAFTRQANANRDAQIAASWTAQGMTPVVDILTGIAMAAVILGGGWLVLGGRIDLGILVAFIFYMQRFFDPIRTVSQQYTMLQRAMSAAQRIFEVIDIPVTLKDAPDAFDAGRLEPSVELRNVTFGYRPGAPVLEQLNLRIAPRETVALVGPTGSGKSSVAALIRRFYDVWEGAVLVGGHDVRTLTLDSLGRNIAMVLQEPFLFTGTILGNIRYARHDATREHIERAARAVNADGFIRALPQGYDTPLDQRGQNLSIGQRQLISFARALVADPQILILDEATASIDSRIEADIQRALRVVMEGRTSILIAHRLATVSDADRIIVLRDGEILEQGSPAALLASGGLYADLHRRNFASFDDA